MEIWEVDKLIIFIAFVIPGFISIKLYQIIYPSTENSKNSSELIVDAIAYSSINYAILWFPILLVERSDLSTGCPFLYYLFYLFVLMLFPIILILFWKFIRTRSNVQRVMPHPTYKPWDFVFGKRKAYWVKVTLKDGSKIAGLYGANSFSSSSPSEEQIYLEQSWMLNKNKGFKKIKKNSEGIIILHSGISYIELYKTE